MGTECGQFNDLALFVAAVADIAGCSDLGCKVEFVDQETSGCTTCSISRTRKIRRRLQSSDELKGYDSEIKFKITATSSALDLNQVNQRLETNLASSNDKLIEDDKSFRFLTVTTTPQTVSPTKKPNPSPTKMPTVAGTSSTTTVSHSNEHVIHHNTKTQFFQTLLGSQTTTSSTGTVRDCFI